MVTCKAAHVVGGEDAGGRIVLMLSSHTFLGMGFQRGCALPALSSGLVVTLSLDLQLINDGFRLQHRLPLTPVCVVG